MPEKFSAERYKQMYGFHTPRLVLLSSTKAGVNVVPVSSYSSESADEYFNHLPWDVSQENNSSANVASELDLKEQDFGIQGKSDKYIEEIHLDYHKAFQAQDDYLLTVSKLIGSSNERRVLVEQIEQNYEVSLASDQAKDQLRKVKEQTTAQNDGAEELRIAKKSQTQSGLNIENPHVIIRVRHPELGLISRAFCPFVLPWVVSLAGFPKHSLLAQTFPHFHLYPDEDISSVGSSELFMVTQEDPVPMLRGLMVTQEDLVPMSRGPIVRKEDPVPIQEDGYNTD